MSKPGSIGAVAPVVPRTHLRSRGEGGAMTFRAVASAAGLVLLSAAAAQAGSVQVEGGAILGAMGSDGAVTHYLGVPFAAAPLPACAGGLRCLWRRGRASWKYCPCGASLPTAAAAAGLVLPKGILSHVRATERGLPLPQPVGLRRARLTKKLAVMVWSTAAVSSRGQGLRCRVSTARLWRDEAWSW